MFEDLRQFDAPEASSATSHYVDFFDSCGVVGPLRIEVENGGEWSTISLDRPFAILGNFANADIVPSGRPDPGSFVYLQALHGRLLCFEVRSRKKNSESNSACMWLSPGQSHTFGLVTVRPVAPANCMVSLRNPKSSPLLIAEGPSGEVWRICQPVALIGSSAACDIQIRGDKVAPFHAALVMTGSDIWIVGLNYFMTARRHEPIAMRCQDRVRVRIGDNAIRLHFRATDQEQVGVLPSHAASVEPVARIDNLPQTQMQEFMSMQRQMFAQFHETIALVVNSLGAMHRDLVDLLNAKMERVDRLDRELAELRAELSHIDRHAATNGDPANRPALPEATSPIPIPKSPLLPRSSSIHPPGVPSDNADVHAWLSQRVAELHQERQSVWSQVCGYLNVLKSSSAPPTTPPSN